MAAGTSQLVVFVVIAACFTGTWAKNHSFTVDYSTATFLKDGQKFRYISGSMHYTRTHPYYWRDRLLKMKVGGLNAVQTYVPWNIHEPKEGQYNWTGFTDLEKFLEIAHKLELVVLLRSGPYICGEWEFGGLPAWLLTKDPSMIVRKMDPTYIAAVDTWMGVLYTKVKPYLYENGGPIVMVQIENEYGSYFACDYDYLRFLYRKARTILGDNVVIYSTDGDGDSYLKCGTLEDVYSTVDFGVTYTPAKNFAIQRHFEPDGPAVNSEFYTGWLDHWGTPHATGDLRAIAKSLDLMLAYGANVNMYMYEGGTNFGFWNGANAPPYQPVPTSYDYEAPLNETGDITDKYLAIRQIISKYRQLPSEPIPPNTPKYPYGRVEMHFVSTVQDALKTLSPGPGIKSRFPLTMEQVEHYYGFILYRHILKKNIISSTLLETNGTRDRGYVMVNKVPMGIFVRESTWHVEVTGKAGQYLDILVENQGRIGFGSQMNYNLKGLITNVTLNGSIIEDWIIYPINLENITKLIYSNHIRSRPRVSLTGGLGTPSIYMGKIPVPDDPSQPQDTFLDPRPWTKGQAFVNSFNLGRYWPTVGPQVTLYVPKPTLNSPPGENYVFIFELESSVCVVTGNCTIGFTDKPFLNKKTSMMEKSYYTAEDFPWHKYH